MKNSNQLKIGKELQAKLTGACKLYRASYDGGRCYAIVHQGSGFTAIFEDKYVYEKLVDRLKSGSYLFLDKDPKGLPRFRIRREGGTIDLRQFIMAKYNRNREDNCGSLPVEIVVDNRKVDNFMDIRKCNVYLPGAGIENRRDIKYEIVDRLGHDGEKYIRITSSDADDNEPCYVTYTPELDTMLRNPKYCYPCKFGKKCRYMVSVNGYRPIDIGKFVAVFKYYFKKYAERENAVEDFIMDFKETRKGTGLSVEHVNGDYCINTFDNLLLVPLELNRMKNNKTKWFAGEYGLFTAVNERGEILIAYQNINLISKNKRVMFYKCSDFESYVDWVLVHLGERLTGKLQVAYNPAIEDEQEVILTPCGMKKAKETTWKTVSENTVDFWEYLDVRDLLLSMPDEAFIIWKSERRLPCPINEDGSIGDIGELFPGIHGEAFIKECEG